MRNETVVRLAVVLIALGQDLAVLDEEQAGHALTVEKVVERAGLLLEPVLDLRLAGISWQRTRRSRLLQRVVLQDAVEMAERSDPDALVIKPVGARADRIAGRLPQQVLVRRGTGWQAQHDKHRA